MKVVIIDPDGSRTVLVSDGLAEARPLAVRRAGNVEAVRGELAAFAPDAIVVVCESADRAILESLREAAVEHPCPVVMFVDKSSPGLAEAAVRAGVAAYVVDGLSPSRVASVLEVAMSRFKLMRGLREDLEKARADLASRKAVDRAKGLLMKERAVGEDEAYRLLRKLAMDAGRSIGAVATDLLTFAGVLKGDRS